MGGGTAWGRGKDVVGRGILLLQKRSYYEVSNVHNDDIREILGKAGNHSFSQKTCRDVS